MSAVMKKKNKLVKKERKTQNDVSLVVIDTTMPYFFYLPSNKLWSRNYFVHKDPIELSVIEK